MTDIAADRAVDAVRRFNRLYTKKIGVLRDRYLKTQFSLAEARVLYELAHRKDATASEVGRELDLDPGYLSRILRSFEARGLIAKTQSERDGRRSLLDLTRQGEAAFATLDQRSRDAIAGLVSEMRNNELSRLVTAIRQVETLLGEQPQSPTPYLLRSHRAGDMGWVVHRHAVLYGQEYRFDQRFEALVADVVAQFLRNYDPEREHCWIAEKDAEIVGSIFVVRDSDTLAKLRLLLVEPSARGLGIGHRLVEECIGFARQAGYRTMTLWTQNVLTAARRIYREAGFRCVAQESHSNFGPEVVGEIWELTL
ncbi:MAG TPA: helix-turn-helix domain-containing GNAT family N-acetyltransferase [Stellaceae bacterium]|nr:helix-turn-helix domain-containing GNAT family N-acetyltransferase [Stellaceae bacterium]